MAAAQSTKSESLHVKYRPRDFNEVVGHDAVINSLEQKIARKEQQAYIFSGPAGTGKTTIARICATELKCEPGNIVEIDAATHTGIDDMRAIQELLRYRPFGASTARAIILDEAHRVTAQAWDSLLKSIEEPPEGVYWFFCTTNPTKIPPTIKSRCVAFQLKPLSEKQLGIIYDDVTSAEKIKLSDDIADLVVGMANGSPRQLLVNLESCRDCKTKKEAAELLQTAVEGDATRELCQFLLKGGSWPKAMTIIKKLEGQEPEGIRIVVMNYMAAVAKNSNKPQVPLAIMDEFATPFNQAEKLAPLILALGRLLLQ